MEPMAYAMILGPLGTTEILIIVLVLVLLFGGRKIPELARGLGKGIQEFKSGLQDSSRKSSTTPPEEPPRREDPPPSRPSGD